MLLSCMQRVWAAVFDGHAGMQVAALASKQLHDNVVSSGFLDASNFPVSYCCLCARGTTAARTHTKLYAYAFHPEMDHPEFSRLLAG